MTKITFHAISGNDHPQTIRFQGKLKGKELVILIMGVAPIILWIKQWYTNLALKFCKTNHSSHGCKQGKNYLFWEMYLSPLNIQGYHTVADFYVLHVGACPLILRVQ